LNALLRNSIFLFLVLLLASCQYFKSKTEEFQFDRTKVARVGNYFLYDEDLSGVIRENMSPEDSLEACNFFVNDWVKNRLLLTKSHEYLPEDLAEINRQAQEYKESLMIYLYETRLIQQNLDTLVTDDEVETYYAENEKNFVLRNPIVNVKYFIVKPESPQIDSVKYWMRNLDDYHLEKLNDYGFQYARKFNVEGEWLELNDFAKQFPINSLNPRQYAQQKRLVELKDDKSIFLLQLDGFISENEVAPLAFKRKEIEKIIAKVGDRIVLYSDVEVQYQQSIAQGGKVDRCEVLDNILLEKLLINQAELDSVDVSEGEVEGELDNRFRYYINLLGSEEAFEEHFKKTVVQFKDEFRPEIKGLLLAQRMQQTVLSSVSVTPSEVRTFYKSLPADSVPYFNAEVEVGQIIIEPKVSKEERDKAYDKLLELKERIESGTDSFENLAQVYSEDPGSGRAGGNLGWTNRGEFVKEFEAAAFKMTNGEMSDIVESQFGFHLIKLIERRGNRINTQHILIKPKVTYDDIRRTELFADSVVNVMQSDTMSFADAVNKFCDDEENRKVGGNLMNPYTGSTIFEMDQIQPEYFFILESMEVGEISAPSPITEADGSQNIKILKLLNKTAPHRANLETDYDRIQQLAKVQKQQQVLNDWVATKTGKTFVEVSKEFDACQQMNKWVNLR